MGDTFVGLGCGTLLVAIALWFAGPTIIEIVQAF